MKKIKLGTNGHFALVDDTDYERVKDYNWWAQQRGTTYYAVARKGNKFLYMHRLILNAPVGKNVHHIDHNGFNNLRENLVLTSHSVNIHNGKKGKGFSSRYRGVSYNKFAKKYSAKISKDGVKYHLGYFKGQKKAAKAYNEKAIELYGDMACLNLV